ncbi:hypothetical protein [Salinisphaera sp.]|uniref:hypothetical protein n=1 Tax=Salinisphaera sp. TaxID=1914330 RepID=UPI000C4FA812|nr:hypothetical protein [Salinisphaera sp.]MBS61531.1 hypothetical protein [Salinisphaera sp.]
MLRPPLDDARLKTLVDAAGLELPPERREVLRPVLDGVLQQLDRLYEVQVDETVPVHSFDARWEAER